MAISFSRPDPSSPASVATANFSTARRGYEPEEVREFLRMVAAELARLQEREKFLERELRVAQRTVPNAAVALDEEVVTRMLGEEAARILATAREAATQIKVRAEEGASRVLREATDEAQRQREEAEIEASRRRQDAASDAESELQMAKQQGREMVNEARAYRERVLGELARRRELARQQIEQLVHGRDRLLNAFERARLAAVDVMAEMTPLGEPNEYVNLSPTTGPVPIMVPAADANPPTTEPDADQTTVLDFAMGAEAEAEPVDDDAAVEVAVVEVAVVEVVDEDAITEDVVAEDAAVEDAVAEDVVTDDIAVEHEAADDVAVEEDVVGEEVTADVEPAGVTEDAADDAAEDDDEPAPIANVVALFAGELDVPLADAAEAQDGEEAKSSVDDLFARLRAARADKVVQRATDATDAEAEPATESAEPAPLADEPALEEAELARVLSLPTPAAPAHEDLAVFQASPPEPVRAAAEDDTPFGKRDADLTPLIVAAARKLKRVLADEQNDVLHILRRNEPVRSLDALLPAPAEHGRRYASAIEGELRQAALAGAASVDDGDRGDHLHEINRAKALQPATDSLRATIVQPLRDRLERAVADAAGDNGDLADAVRSLYREWKTQRIDEHLDDVARMAFGRGALVALVPGTPVIWTVDPNGPACPDAEDNALAGVIGAGQPFPTDHTCAPAHEGCRCMLQRAQR